MTDVSKIALFRITHIQNIRHILQYGITHRLSPNRNPNYTSIGDGSLISSRNNFGLPNKKRLGDYTPFYFGPRMPMLYVIQKGFNGVIATHAKDIVYCVTSVAAVQGQKLAYVFTDGHAVDGLTTFYSPTDILLFDTIVDMAAVKKTYWKDEADLDIKRRKEAEFLVLGDVLPQGITGFVVYNEEAQKHIQSLPGLANKPVIIKPDYYF